jgi:hypothetical protein
MNKEKEKRNKSEIKIRIRIQGNEEMKKNEKIILERKYK